MAERRRLFKPIVVAEHGCFEPISIGFLPLFPPRWYLFKRLKCWRRGHIYTVTDRRHLTCSRCECYWFALAGYFAEARHGRP